MGHCSSGRQCWLGFAHRVHKKVEVRRDLILLRQRQRAQPAGHTARPHYGTTKTFWPLGGSHFIKAHAEAFVKILGAARVEGELPEAADHATAKSLNVRLENLQPLETLLQSAQTGLSGATQAALQRRWARAFDSALTVLRKCRRNL